MAQILCRDSLARRWVKLCLAKERKELKGDLNILTFTVDLKSQDWKASCRKERIRKSWGKPRKGFGPEGQRGGKQDREEGKDKGQFGPETPQDTTPSIWDQGDGNGRRKTLPRDL